MSESELLTIGAFARACGLSTSALRFYADAGVLVPAAVDEISGYRYYAPDQAGTAQLIRHLRAVDMPLPAVVAVLAEHDPARAAELVDAHLAGLDRQLQAVRAAAEAARAAVQVGPLPAPATGTVMGADREPLGDSIVWMRGPMLAAAVDQVATATVMDPDMPVLNSIHLEARGQELILTATDRYRLATRSLRTASETTADYTETVDADDLRAAASWLRSRHTVAVRPGSTHLEITSGDPAGNGRADALGPDRRRCRRAADEFPDYRAMLAALPAVVTRVVLNRAELLDALERTGSPTITLHVDPAGVVRTAEGRDAPRLPATVTGPGMTIHFAVITLYPAVAGAVGPDVMLDLIAPDLPARIRSADDGDQLTLAMPCRQDTEETSR